MSAFGHTPKLHALRVDGPPAAPVTEAQLVSAYRSLQLHWLAHLPGYRETIKARVSAERKRRARIEQRMERHLPRADVDRLGTRDRRVWMSAVAERVNGNDPLHWLAELPGYRALIKARLSEKVHERVDPDIAEHIGVCVGCGGDLTPGRVTEDCPQCRDRGSRWRRRQALLDVDQLGREVDGCG